MQLRRELRMMEVSRRNFLRGTAGAIGAATFVSGTSAVATPLPRATDMRTLGNTGLQCSYLGIGTGIRGRGRGITDQTMGLSGNEYVELLEHAYAKGLTYFDLADQYGSHNYMREAMRRSIDRDKVLLLTKLWRREPENVKLDLDRTRAELNTDCIDAVLLHCVRDGEENWPETLKGAMDALADAKARGIIRAHGVSCHNLEALERVPDTPWVDLALVRINPFGVNMDGPLDRVVPIIQRMHAAGQGVLGMKVLGQGASEVVDNMDESLKFVANLGAIHALTVGFMSTAELDDVVNRMARIGAAK